MLPKNTTYTFIQAYMFIIFQQKVPPIRLFPPILLLFFREISHLYFYLDSSSIRNSRVIQKFSLTLRKSEWVAFHCEIIEFVRLPWLQSLILHSLWISPLLIKHFFVCPPFSKHNVAKLFRKWYFILNIWFYQILH